MHFSNLGFSFAVSSSSRSIGGFILFEILASKDKWRDGLIMAMALWDRGGGWSRPSRQHGPRRGSSSGLRLTAFPLSDRGSYPTDLDRNSIRDLGYGVVELRCELCFQAFSLMFGLRVNDVSACLGLRHLRHVLFSAARLKRFLSTVRSRKLTLLLGFTSTVGSWVWSGPWDWDSDWDSD